MPGTGFTQRGLDFIRLHGHPSFYRLIARAVGASTLSEEQLQRLHHLGALVGLEPVEVQKALAASSEKPSGFPGWLKWFVVSLGIIAGVTIGAFGIWYFWYLYMHSGPWPGYMPGTLYGALGPRDFEN